CSLADRPYRAGRPSIGGFCRSRFSSLLTSPYTVYHTSHPVCGSSKGMSIALASSIGMAPVSATTLADQIADRIIDAIAARRIEPGARLTEGGTAGQLQG